MNDNHSGAILITGVGKRIGYGLAAHFLAQGIPVVGTYRSWRDSLDSLQKQGASLYPCDFYDANAVTTLIQTLQSQQIPLRAIIHNASDWLPDNSPLPAAEIFTRMMLVHANVPYQLNNALAAHLESPGDIIHITDYVAQTGSKKHIAYAASKAALENMTLSFAALLAPDIKVNAIAPALMLFNPDDDDAYRAKALEKSLLQKEGGLQEVLDTVDYLMASTYITGRILHLDGGRHLKR